MKIVTKTLSKNHNVSQKSDSSIFLKYVGFFFVIAIVLYLFFLSLGFFATSIISSEMERKIFSQEFILDETIITMPTDLQARYESDNYSIDIIDMDIENAFASLGSRVYLTEELLKNTKYIESLDFIVGHELGHVENRDVFQGLVSDVPMAIVLSLFSGNMGNTIFQSLISNTYSRTQESRADIAGIEYVQKKNGHVGCALDFFERKNSALENMSEVFSTHPMTFNRIQNLEAYIKLQGYESRECTPYNYTAS